VAFDDLSESSGTISQINVTPLVDVMLVLLIIFMVAVPILQQGVELELPQETISPIEGNDEQLVVSIDKAGKVFLGKGNEVATAEIGKRVKASLEAKADKRVFIRADKRVPYGEVMAVMGSIRRSGIEKLGLITEPS
jgi:biopolymer transport protein TolR